MQLPVDFFDTFVPELIKENVQVKVMGFTDSLPLHTQEAVKRAIDQTKDNTGMILNFALNYGSRAEILTEDMLGTHLMTGFLPSPLRDPELVIRTSGEERVSNFLLWQIAYSELFFTKALWPDFDAALLEDAIGSFQQRNRRFGGLKTEEEEE